MLIEQIFYFGDKTLENGKGKGEEKWLSISMPCTIFIYVQQCKFNSLATNPEILEPSNKIT